MSSANLTVTGCSSTTYINKHLPSIYNSVESAVGPDYTKILWSNAESRPQLVWTVRVI